MLGLHVEISVHVAQGGTTKTKITIYNSQQNYHSIQLVVTPNKN